jgi:hypothetical protein
MTFVALLFLMSAGSTESVSGITLPEALIELKLGTGTRISTTVSDADAHSALHGYGRLVPARPVGWNPTGRACGLSVMLANVFDRNYRVHGSGIDSPGRNAWVSLRWRF